MHLFRDGGRITLNALGMRKYIMNGFYKRKLLTLELRKQSPVLKEHIFFILGSPLGLAEEIIKKSFDYETGGIAQYREKLDSIKRMALGISSAEKSAEQGDKLASYSIFLYAFQQFFQSSIRARQGHVLDRALAKILEENGFTNYGKKHHKEALRGIGVQTETQHDTDVVASYDDKYTIIQIRSRDDTGGTTAKGSLVELIRDIQQSRMFPNRQLLYLIYIWEPLGREQRESLISRIGGSLNLGEEEKSILREGKNLRYGSNLDLQLAYGPEELVEAIKGAFSLEIDETKYTKLIEMISDWDDLWLSYSLATLELENMVSRGINNFNVLDTLLEVAGIKIDNKIIEDYEKSSCEIAKTLVTLWKADTICFPAPAEQLNYIRDLVLLKIAKIAIG